MSSDDDLVNDTRNYVGLSKITSPNHPNSLKRSENILDLNSNIDIGKMSPREQQIYKKKIQLM